MSILLVLALAAHVSHANGSNDVVTCVSELVRLLYAEPTPKVPFDITATATFTSKDSPSMSMTLAIEDSTGAVVIGAMNSRYNCPVRIGDLIRVVGKTIQHPNRPVTAGFTSLKTIRHGVPPTATTVDAKSLLAGRHDFRLCRFKGMVREGFLSETNNRWLILVLNSDGETIYVSIPRLGKTQDDIDRLLGATVAVTGICLPYDGGYRIQTGRWFKCSGLDSVEVLQPVPDDPFAAPGIEELLFMRPSEIATQGLHTLSGFVSAAWGNGHTLVQPVNAKPVRVKMRRPPFPKYGDRIDAVGLPESNLYSINLTEATWRHNRNVANIAEEPVQATVDNILQDSSEPQSFNMRHDGRLFRFRGDVRDISPDGKRILVSHNGYGVSAMIDALPPDARDAVKIGCQVEVTGTCVMDIENWRPNAAFPHVKGIYLVARTPEDVKVLSVPPWWTPGRLTVVIVMLLAVLAGFLFWNRSLKALAERRGHELMQERMDNIKTELKVYERTRLAVELHDSLAQSLTGVSMELEAADELKGDAPTEMLMHMQLAAQALKSCRAELRNCLWDLRSQALEEPNMTKAILRTLQPQINDSRLVVRFNVPRESISDNTTHAILNMIRELVVNAIRHGNATTIKIAGTKDNGFINMSVRDNGCGFDPDTCPGVLQGHFGLQGIRERIGQLHGIMDIKSAAGKGTKVSISIPDGNEEHEDGM